MCVSVEKYCKSPKALPVSASIISGFFIKNPLLGAPTGKVLLLNKLALCFFTISVTSKSVSKESPAKNC